jgi:hypothetical protein
MPIAFTFDQENHICRTLDGKFVPTVTQYMELARISPSFKTMVRRGIILQDTLDRRSWIGREVHDLTDTLDQDGEINPMHLCAETEGYVVSWEGFKQQTGFVPQAWSIRRCESISGHLVSGESDVEGYFARHPKIPVIVDKKTGTVASDSWGVQCAMYEQLKYRSPQIGRCVRAVAWLHKDGSPGRLLEYPEVSPVDGAHYGDTALAAIHCVNFGLRRGYLSELDVME